MQYLSHRRTVSKHQEEMYEIYVVFLRKNTSGGALKKHTLLKYQKNPWAHHGVVCFSLKKCCRSLRVTFLKLDSTADVICRIF